MDNTDDDARNEHFFGFGPADFTADVMNSVEDYFSDGFDHLEKAMVPPFPFLFSPFPFFRYIFHFVYFCLFPLL